MKTTYEKRNINGKELAIRTTEVTYLLPRITEYNKVWDEETERFRTVRNERRPELEVTTRVVCSKNRFGLVRLYGPQGM